jgi:metallo-beta-lactamase family protein
LSNPSNFDEETRSLIRRGINPLFFPDLRAAVSSDESRAINFIKEPMVIISASGMCEAGRIRHHLKHNLWRKESLILFAGYQTRGTLGRSILDGAKEVRLFGETITVEAEVDQIQGISGHADRGELLEWISGFKTPPKKVFVNHGSEDSCEAFVKLLREEHGYDAASPYSGASFDLLSGEFVTLPQGVYVHKEPRRVHKRGSRAFARLIAACEHLLFTAKGCEGMANKELARFADQIEQIAHKMVSKN